MKKIPCLESLLLLLEKIIKIYKQSFGETSDINSKILEEHAIARAIVGRSVQCINLLINQLQNGDKLTDCSVSSEMSD